MRFVRETAAEPAKAAKPAKVEATTADLSQPSLPSQVRRSRRTCGPHRGGLERGAGLSLGRLMTDLVLGDARFAARLANLAHGGAGYAWHSVLSDGRNRVAFCFRRGVGCG